MELPSLYRALVEDAPDPIWVFDLEGRTLFGNRALADLLATDVASLLDLTVFDTLDEEGQGHARGFLEDLRAGRPTPDVAESLVHDVLGQPRWVLLRQHLLRDADGAVTAVVHRLSDYEERRAAHVELSRSQERLREVQTIARIEEWSWRTRGEPESIEDMVEVLHPRDRVRAASALADAVADARSDGPTRELQIDVRQSVRAQDTGAADRWWRVRAVAHLEPDGHVRFTGSRQDVTEVKETERALRRESELNALLRRVASSANEADSVLEAFRRLDQLDQPFDQWRQAHVLVCGADGTLAPVASTRRAGPLGPQTHRMAEAAAASRRTQWAPDDLTVAFPVLHDGRARIVVALSGASPPANREQVEQMLGDVALQLEHVVEREEARLQLAQARDAAMEASLQKSQFLATMSHEIRTPLNGILGLNELLFDSPLEPEQRRLVAGAQSAGRTLLRLINEVLDFSRIEAAGLQLERLPFDVAALLEHVVRLGDPARPADVTLRGVCDPAVPPMLVGDPTKLSQVLGNLLANALKFTESGHVEVSLSMVSPDADSPDAPDAADDVEEDADVLRLRCEVADTGIGIGDDASRVEELFEPFVQGDNATALRLGGTGLGLAVARDIVTALGGSLAYRPNPGGGSVFSFDVVCSTADSSVTAADTRAGVSLAGRRVLLVSDDAARRATWSAALARWRTTAVDVEADRAVAALQGGVTDGSPFDAVLLDLDRARTGLELAQEVASLEELDDVVMVLLRDDSVDADRVLEAGISASLPRPVSVSAVRAALLEHVAGVPVPARSRTAQGPAYRVLVVEDNAANQLVATTLLGSMGFDHDVAPDGAQALELMDRGTYDAVLMDVQMPVLDGYDTTRAIRERERERRTARVPVVAITASAVPGERERCLEAGMDDFLTKPVDLAALTRTLRRWVGLVDSSPTTGELELDRKAPGPPPGEPPLLDTSRLDMLLDLDLDGEAYLVRAIANFARNSVEAVARIGDLLASDRPEAAGPVAHKIAGSALNLGCLRAGEQARSFEVACEGLVPGRPHGLEARLRELEASMGQARELLAGFQRDRADH